MSNDGERAGPSERRARPSGRPGRAGRRVLEDPVADLPRRPRRVTLLVGAGVLVLALAVAGIVVAVRGDGRTGTAGGRPASSTGLAPAPSTSSAPPAAKASDAVRGYLQALAANDAGRALAYADVAPTDLTFLTAETLQASTALAPLAGIDVPEVSDENAFRVPAQFSLGARAYRRDFEVARVGDAWKVKDAVVALDLGAERKPGLAMLLNGIAVGTDTVAVFPGTYAVSTGSRWVSWGTSATITVADAHQVPAPTLTPTLTKAGRDTVLTQTKAAFQACLAQHQLAPAGCPNRLQKSEGTRIVESSIRWRVTKDPFTDAMIALDRAAPSLARGRFSSDYRIKATARSTGQSLDADIVGLPSFQAVADLTKDPVAVTFIS